MGSYQVRLVFSAVLVAAAVAPWPAWNASAGCAAPSLEVVGTDDLRPTLTRGATVTVSGRSFVDGCNDTGGSSTFGCTSEEEEPVLPHEDISLTITQGDRRWELGTEDAGTADDNQLGQVTWTVTIPADLEPGRALLQADPSEPLPVFVQ